MRTDGSAAAQADEVGEIWVAGPSVALGYWNNLEATHKAFVERDGVRWLRTGDVGFIRDGALVVTGRLKDLLIVRGQNVYPTDVEQAVEADVELVRSGRVAAFAVEIDGRESIGVAAEFSRAVLKRSDPEALAHAIGEAVLRQAQEYPAVIVLLNPQGDAADDQRQTAAFGLRRALGRQYARQFYGLRKRASPRSAPR